MEPHIQYAKAEDGVEFEDCGAPRQRRVREQEMKGVAEPQRLFAVRAAGSP